MNRVSFWDYSIIHYALPGVAESCLRLQDEYGLDVNLVLCCLWYGHCYGELSPQQLECLTEFSDKWSGQVVSPLRQVRRWMKSELTSGRLPGAELASLRSQVKQLELQAEHLQQDKLEALLVPSAPLESAPISTGQDAMSTNLNRYLQHRNLEIDNSLQLLLESLLVAFQRYRSSNRISEDTPD